MIQGISLLYIGFLFDPGRVTIVPSTGSAGGFSQFESVEKAEVAMISRRVQVKRDNNSA